MNNLGSNVSRIPGLGLLKDTTATASLPPSAAGVSHSTSPSRPLSSKARGKLLPWQQRKQAKQQASFIAEDTSAQIAGPSLRPSLLFTTTTKPPTTRDGRQRPSKESGGTPEPTHFYINQACGAPATIAPPRPILVIVDLNGTLLHRPNKKRPSDFIERPHASRFLRYCINTFTVAIWSSARPDNVNKMMDRLLTPEERQRCVVTWARDKFQLSVEDYDARVQCYKRLTRLWADPIIRNSHPDAARGGRWDQTNTVLVDDSVEKARSEPHNILEIPEFSGMAHEPPHVLPQVHDYLNSLCYQKDISRFIRRTPFTLNPNYTLESSPSV